jgi:hypothetical protein
LESEVSLFDAIEFHKQTTVRIPADATSTRRGGKKHVEVHDPRTSVTMPTPGGELTLYFDGPLAEGPLREVRLIPGAEPWRLMSRLPLYVQYAKAAAAMRQNDTVAALRALRDAGTGVRGHGDDFYRTVASMYNAFVAAGEPSPIKAIAESQPVTISAASKWVKRARELGLIPEKEVSHAS